MPDLDPAQHPPREGAAAARDRRGRDTRLALILAAERVFAAEGVANTPLRQVAKAAQQRNASVMQYYFASREALVEVLFEGDAEELVGRTVDVRIIEANTFSLVGERVS